VHTVGIYAARFGALLTFPLQELLNELAGKPVEIDKVAHTVVVLADQESFDPTR
jgi:hypothetical protein